MLQDLDKPLFPLYLPVVTEQQSITAEAQILRLQQHYKFFGLPYQMVESDYFKVFLRKLYLDPIYRQPGANKVPMDFIQCPVSALTARQHLCHASGILRLWHFLPEDAATLYRALDLRGLWDMHREEATIEMKRYTPPILN